MAANGGKDTAAFKRQCELLLQVIDGQEPEDEAQREKTLRTIWAIEHGMYQPPEALPRMFDERARVITARLRAQLTSDSDFNALPIPAADLEALRQRYPAPAFPE